VASAAPALGPAEDIILPGLRQELRIERGAPLVTGAPSWTLFDPVRHMFYQLGKLEFRIFALWQAGSLNHIRAGLAADGVEEKDANLAIGRVLDFSFQNSLTVTPNGPAVEQFTAQRKLRQREWWKWLVDNYLFIRIPIVKPTAFLQRTMPLVAPLWSRTSLSIFVAIALLGFILVARQWDAFVASFLYFFTWQGLIAYGIALGGVKIIHELGHAYTATRFGVRVPTMGISVLIMMPVLYTDTTAAWRLTSRKQRMMIDCAGVGAELMVASVCTLLWSFVPDGAFRSGLFVLATTSWIASVLINISPFMRYDGYYVLSDALGVPNLQPRSFALARWWLREKLFDLGEAPPEYFPKRLETGLIVYAIVTWVYRLILFIGIALLVYHMFFKALGIILFAVEMVVFIGRPIMNEISAWWTRREAIGGSKRARLWAYVLGGLALLMILPLDRSVTAPAVLSPIGDAPLVSGDPAQIAKIHVRNGDQVAAGAPIATLAAPDLDRDAALHRVEIARLSVQMDRAMSDAQDMSNRAVLERQLKGAREALAGTESRRAKLVLRAPIAGVVVDVDTDIHPGRWLGGAEVVARIVTPGRYDVQAYAAQDDIWRLDNGASARFVPDDPAQASRAAKLVEAANSAAQNIDLPVLASTNGGPIAVASSDKDKLKPRQPVSRLRLVAVRDDGQVSTTPQSVPGRVIIDAAGQSLLSRAVKWVGSIVAREWSVTG
jgi:putative peptide zinc metalloprotease protein